METYIEQVKSAKKNRFLMCYSYAVGWVKHQKEFTSEDLRNDYELTGSPIPEEPRVWGAVIRALKKSELIKHYGFSIYKKPCGHKKPVNVWITK